MSNSTANNYKKFATKTNLIEVKKNYSYMVDGNGDKLTREHIPHLIMNYPKIAGRSRISDNYVRIVEADSVKSEIKTKLYKYVEKK